MKSKTLRRYWRNAREVHGMSYRSWLRMLRRNQGTLGPQAAIVMLCKRMAEVAS